MSLPTNQNISKVKLIISEQRSHLGEIVKDSTEKNRQFFVTYLGLAISIMLMVFSTTDRQLLIPSLGIKLPLIDVTLPLVNFYLFAPVVLLALHFNLLQNIEAHHYKLVRWQNTWPKKIVPREEISPFLFNHQWLESDNFIKRAVNISSNFLFLHSGPIALGILLWRFTDYQNIYYTTWHLVIFVIDVILVWLVEQAFEQNKYPIGVAPVKTALEKLKFRWFSSIAVFFRKLCDFLQYFISCRWRAFFDVLILLQFTIACWFYFNEDPLIIQRWAVQQLVQLVNDKPRSNYPQILLSLIENRSNFFFSAIIPIIEISPNETVWLPNKDLILDSTLIDGVNSTTWWEKNGQGLDLSNRHLRGLSLPDAYLPKVNFSGSYLEGADLSAANLNAANFDQAHMKNVDLRYARIKEGNFERAEMQGDRLWGTLLQGANLFGANLHRAELLNAQLQGANLEAAELQGASLFYVQFEGANLTIANLHKYTGNHVNWQGANLTSTMIKGTPQAMDMQMNRSSVTSTFGYDKFPNGLTTAQMQAVDLDARPLLGAIFSIHDKPDDIVWKVLIPNWDNSIDMTYESKIYAAEGLKRNYEDVFGSISMDKHPEYMKKINQAFCDSRNLKSMGENCP